MTNDAKKPNPWLIAAWPGMGSVALIAAGYLVNQLKMTPVSEFRAEGHFDINEAEFKDGVISPARLPRGVFFRWTNPGHGRDLVIFLGEAQPAAGTYAYAHELLDTAAKLGADRVITFASMACGLHPAENPRVTGVATDADTLGELSRAEVQPLTDGQIGGLNGVLLAAAAQRGIPGLCLLAEIPSFAVAVPNPKAARAALSVFCILAGIDLSLDDLNKQAAAIDHALIEVVEKLERQRPTDDSDSDDDDGRAGSDDAPGSPQAVEPDDPAATSAEPPEPSPDIAARRRIEQLFAQAAKDHSKAAPLKEELDRLHVFKRYEDRFLDLFRRAA